MTEGKREKEIPNAQILVVCRCGDPECSNNESARRIEHRRIRRERDSQKAEEQKVEEKEERLKRLRTFNKNITSGEPRLIAMLDRGSQGFPIYWAHYAAWYAFANATLSKRDFSNLNHLSQDPSALTSVDFQWTTKALQYLQAVKEIYPGHRHITPVLILELADEQRELIDTAVEASRTLHPEIALEILGSPEDFEKRLCTQGPPDCNLGLL